MVGYTAAEAIDQLTKLSIWYCLQNDIHMTRLLNFQSITCGYSDGITFLCLNMCAIGYCTLPDMGDYQCVGLASLWKFVTNLSLYVQCFIIGGRVNACSRLESVCQEMFITK